SAYDALERDDRLRLDGLRAALASGDRVSVLDTRLGRRFSASCVLTTRERDILLAGGLLAQTSRTRAPEAGHPRSAPASGTPVASRPCPRRASSARRPAPAPTWTTPSRRSR